ncbi:hypothetical protein OAD50_01425 [Vicingaceae bacterium]|nr:hypothetical protein [Vicingaceae bacterium]
MPFDTESGKKAGKKSKRSKSKSTIELQDIFSSILSDNADNIQKWLNNTAEKQPDKALDLILKMSSFVMPKIRAVELEEIKQCNCENLSKLTPISFVSPS